MGALQDTDAESTVLGSPDPPGPSGRPVNVLGYEVWGPTAPDVTVDIDEAHE